MFSKRSFSSESGAIQRFVITTSVNQVSTASIKFEEDKRLDNMTG